MEQPRQKVKLFQPVLGKMPAISEEVGWVLKSAECRQ